MKPSSLPFPPQPRRAAALAVAAALAAPQAFAADAFQPATSVRDVVVTTGVRGEERTVADSPVPIDVIPAEDLVRTGKATLKETLATLLPSFNFTPVAGVTVNNVIRPLSLRGLSGAYTLVLVNGKRRHNSAAISNSGVGTTGANPVDLDQIPVAAVDHVEVLRDGAAAQYGSDAIAGVVNIILKTTDHGGESTTTVGGYYKGDGITARENLGWGTTLGQDGFLRLSLDAATQERSERNDPGTGSYYFRVDGQPDPRESSVGQRGDRNGNPELKAVSTAANAEIGVGDGKRLYGFATAGARNAEAWYTTRRPNSTGDLIQLRPDGFIPKFYLHEFDTQLVGGLRGEDAGWNWDASASVSRNRINSHANTLNPSLGPDGPTQFKLYGITADQAAANLDVRRGIDVGLGKPLQAAFGGEYRRERYSLNAGDAAATANGGYVYDASYGDGSLAGRPANVGVQGVNAISAANAGSLSRGVSALYADFGANATDKLWLGAAGRGERYDDSSGSTFSGKLSARYEVDPALALRGNFNTGFRAPSLSQQVWSQTFSSWQVVNGVSILRNSTLASPGSELARALGATELKPERSRNLSVGFSLTPTRDLTLTADAYRIRIADRIVSTGYFSGSGVDAILAAAGLQTGQLVQYFTNAVDTTSKGIDVVADWRRDLGTLGVARFNLGFNWNRTGIDSIKDTPAALKALGFQVLDRAAQGSLTDGYPRTKLILGTNWLYGDFDTGLRLTRYDKVIERNATSAANDVTYGAKWLTDLDVSWHVTPSTTLAVGANNLFNVHADKSPFPTTNGARYGYGVSIPFSYYGGFWYARLGVAF
ncbi:TonB-dependent receptor plug domain-containing protein [Derxia gummosa]|uniref:TonB-dependent receptor plug domain-containing protein n=1 Tax=Derxia gummosa DSM 723 TaxID=1121388 RepID=A0A8B6X3P1_9BURK|nr:TonB-dependent receptor [Derxia gummosa]